MLLLVVLLLLCHCLWTELVNYLYIRCVIHSIQRKVFLWTYISFAPFQEVNDVHRIKWLIPHRSVSKDISPCFSHTYAIQCWLFVWNLPFQFQASIFVCAAHIVHFVSGEIQFAWPCMLEKTKAKTNTNERRMKRDLCEFVENGLIQNILPFFQNKLKSSYTTFDI